MQEQFSSSSMEGTEIMLLIEELGLEVVSIEKS